MSDKSILVRMDEEGHEIPRVKLEGTHRNDDATKRYEVIGELARGGVGVVHRGRDNDVGRDVALKVLRDEHLANPELVQRFVEEAQIGGQLQHPGIVPVYELGIRRDKRPYFAMKLVKGDTLAARLAQRASPSESRRELLAVFRDVCRTMSYAHARGVIHRDLKPSNVMIGSFGEVQVVDWGFAKVLRKGGIDDESLARKAERDRTMISTVRSDESSARSIAGSVMGTPAYMPPEQATGRVEELDEQSDIFSLGGILAEILTGQPPYTGSDGDRMTAAARARLDPAMQRLASCGADERVIALCERCLAPLPKDRPARAQALAESVAAYLASAEGRAHRAKVRAVHADADAKEQRRRRRQTRVVGAGVLTAFALAAGVWFWIDSGRRERERDTNTAIETALQDAELLRAARDWQGALRAADRAIQLGHDGTVTADIRTEAREATEQAQRQSADEAFLAELETIRGRWGQGNIKITEGRGQRRAGVALRVAGPYWEKQQRAVDAQWVAAFRARFGSIKGSLIHLQSSHCRSEIAANLTFWSLLRKTHQGLEGSDWRSVDRLARALDPGNDTIRDALYGGDADVLLDCAREQADRLPLALVPEVGRALMRAGHPLKALEFLRNQTRRAPDEFWIHKALVQVALHAGHADLAIRHATAAVALRPSHSGAWSRLATSLGRQDRDDRTAAAHRRAIDLDPENPILHSNFGAWLWKAGKASLAIESCRRALALDENYAPALVNLALGLVARGDVAEGLAAFERAILVRPKHALTRANYGVALHEGGDSKAGMAAYLKAIELDAKCALAHTNMGVTLREQNQLDAAIEAHRTATEAEPRFVPAYLNLGGALIQKGDYTQAIAAFEKAVQLAPRQAATHAGLGSALSHNGDNRRARRALRKALELNPREADAHYNLGVLDAVEGKPDAALAHYRKAAEVDPRHPKASYNLGSTLFRLGRIDEALGPLEKAAQVTFDQPQVFCNLGLALQRVGRWSDSVEWLERGHALGSVAPEWTYPSAQWIARSRGLAAVEARFSAELRRRFADVSSELESADRSEAQAFGEMAVAGYEPLLALDCFRAAFPDDPGAAAPHYAALVRRVREALAEHAWARSAPAGHWRYNGACAGALAGEEHHEQALEWLRADLDAWESLVEAKPDTVAETMAHWQGDRDLAAVRDVEGLSEAWRKLWAGVEALLQRARKAAGD